MSVWDGTNMTKIDSFQIKGASGSKYAFDVYWRGVKFNAVGAVYAMVKRTERLGAAAWYEFIYIGETGDLSSRFDNHHKDACFDRKGADCIGIHREDNAGSRLVKEEDILKAHQWPCND